MFETRAARPPLAVPALVWILVSALAFAPAPPAAAQDGRAVRDTVAATLVQRQRTQTAREDWEKERIALTARYRAAQADLAALAPRVAERADAVAATRDRVDELKRRLLESDRLGASLQDTLLALVDRLDAAVAVDLPFLPDERAQRLSLLREELAKPAVEPAEKLRRVLEALMVEASYGSSVEVVRDNVVVDGESLYADVLRLGRVALFWRTPDGEHGGWFDPASRTWAELPGGDLRLIGRAMEMAAHRRPVELIELPLGRIAP